MDLASDSKLKRDVAIKVLPDEFLRDPERLSRFQREAEVLASLNHPNIGAIYDLAEFGEFRFLVLELVEGDTLADILAKRGALPLHEALQISKQICLALEAAYEKGVVHRDLKPANVKVMADGHVKVLDFGLAKAVIPAVEENVSNSPIDTVATAQGLILGTAAYMSPEQARGMSIDHRTDIWAFGCVLYQMLTGRPAFEGELASDVLASILTRDPDYARLGDRLHPRLQETLRRCLEKDRKMRWQAIGDVRIEIEQALADPVEFELPAKSATLARQSKSRFAMAWAAVGIVLGALAAWFLKPSPLTAPRAVVRFEYELPEGQVLRQMGRSVVALSPDGTRYVYNTTRGLLLRSMDGMTSRLIPGTEGLDLSNPIFSPDGEWVGYYAAGELRKISVTGGVPVSICKASNDLFGASWNADGTILFGQVAGIKRVSADGSEAKLVIRTENNEVAYGPELLPDGDTVLFTLGRLTGTARWDQAKIVSQSIKSGARQVVLQTGADAHYAPTGHLTYAQGNALFAVPFDLKKLQVVGGPVPIIQGMQRAVAPGNTATTADSPSANYGFSNQGTLVYFTGFPEARAPDGVLALVDRNGKGSRLNVPPAQYRHPRVSPDGRQIVVETIDENGQSIVWVYDLSGNTTIRRLTTEDGTYTRPIWTPDSKQITYASDREKPQGIYSQLADGSGLPERLTSAPEGYEQYPESWSRDGVLSFASVHVGGIDWGLWTLSSEDKNKPKLFYDAKDNQFGSVFSPDGKWIAYASNEAGGLQFRIYVQPFPPTGAKYQISSSGGAWPIWSPTGNELFYRLNSALNVSQLNAVTITTKPVPAFSSEKILQIRDFLAFINYRDYDIMPNGREFLMMLPVNQTTSRETPPRIHVVLNWFEELKQRVPAQ